MAIRSKNPAALVALACLAMAPLARASVISLDFDSAATGANLGSAPLFVAQGTITLSQGIITPNGHPTNGIESVLPNDADRTLLSFDFDVSSVTFDFSGEGGGNFIAEVLDIGGAVLASFSVTGTHCTGTCFDGTDVVLSAAGIRGFRFADAPGGGNIALVDNVRLEAAAGTGGSVPEPASFGLAGLALLGLGAVTRRGRRRA